MKEIEYQLIAIVDGETVFLGRYEDTVGLEEELYKAENAVDRKLKEEKDLI